MTQAERKRLVALKAGKKLLTQKQAAERSASRSDRCGGSTENRMRFVVETIEAMIAAAGSPGKVGMKVSPGMNFNDLQHDDPMPTYLALAKAIAQHRLAYLHIMRASALKLRYETSFREPCWLVADS
jgi:N-ethylmaleimide reductase